jgi:hypothetical protein
MIQDIVSAISQLPRRLSLALLLAPDDQREMIVRELLDQDDRECEVECKVDRETRRRAERYLAATARSRVGEGVAP